MYRPIVNKKMNYNNFKRHEYHLNWIAAKDNDNPDKRYKVIQMVISREEPYPYGEIVKDPYEFKYGCKINRFDFDSLYTDEKGRFFIKEGSKEWINYLNEPGIPHEEYMKQQYERMLAKEIREQIKIATGQDIKIGLIDVNGDGSISLFDQN